MAVASSESQYFSGTVNSKTSCNIYSFSDLRKVIGAVIHTPFHAIDSALRAAGAKNVKAVKPFIDAAKVKLGEDGKLTGLDEQVKGVQKAEGYLFAEKQQGKGQTFKGFQPGLPVR
ncbi:MAG: phage scaffolding protein [Clostridium sp.]|nr:phage scaffolding protein [Clostridium sp.]